MCQYSSSDICPPMKSNIGKKVAVNPSVPDVTASYDFCESCKSDHCNTVPANEVIPAFKELFVPYKASSKAGFIGAPFQTIASHNVRKLVFKSIE